MVPFSPRDFDNPSPNAVLSLISFGTWCSLILTGQSAQEAYTYFRRYPKDGFDLKALIGTLSSINALHASFLIHVNYSLGIQHASHADITLGALQQLWSFWVLEATACIIILVSHFFFARRVYKLGLRTLPFVLFVGIMLLAGLVFTCFFTVYVCLKGTEANKPTAINMICILGISLLLDLVITFRLVNYLRNSRTGFRHTDNILNRLTLFAVNTGLLTGILTLLPIILMAGPMRNGLAWYPVMTMLAPVHTSVVLAAVNSRRSLIDRGSEGIELRSFDLDVWPQPESCSTIEWADAVCDPDQAPLLTAVAYTSLDIQGTTRGLLYK